MIIKHLDKHTIGLGLLCIWMLMGLCACSTDTADAMHEEEVPPAIGFTYTMRLNGLLSDFNQSARATHSWADGSKLYLQFIENGNRIQGSATFNLEEDTWTVSTTSPLTAPDDAYCEVYYFTNPSAALTSSVTMDLKTASYADKNGTYILEEDDAIAVTASLSPLTGRIRFVGTPKTTYKISGLTTYTNYSASSNTFTAASRQLSVSLDEEGSSSYFYALFEDDHQLVVDGEGKSAYLRTFADHVLTAGSSGFVTLPSAENLGSWTLVNAENLQEITLPTLSTITVSKILSKSAGVSVTITNLGNGSILECGLVCSTNETPTLENGTHYDGNKAQEITLRVKSLEPETYYYVRAYVRNELDIVWSETANFKTISKEEEADVISREDYDQEEDWNDNSTTSGSVDKSQHGEDEDLNDKSTTSGSINKTEHGEDEDLNDKSTTSGSINKTEHGEDEDLNDKSTTSGSVNKTEHGEDEDLNDKSTTSGNINKSEFDKDEDWNTTS